MSTNQVRDDLEALRADTLVRLTEAGDRDFTALGKLLIDINNLLAAMDGGAKGRATGLDEFTKRLAERQRAATPDQGGEAVGSD